MRLNDLKQAGFDWINENRQRFSRWHAEIWDFHEPAWREYRSAAWYIERLRNEGFEVEEGSGGMDPSRKSGGALHRLHCFCLEFDGACEVQRRVPTDWIIEPIDVSGYGSFSLAS